MNPADLKDYYYSAKVRMQLSLNDHVFSIAQLGPDFIILRNRIDHPAGTGEIALWIDDYERRWSVNLPDGIRADQDETRISYRE